MFPIMNWVTYAEVTSTMVADSGVEFGRGLAATRPRASSAEMAVDMYMIVILIALM